MHTSDSVFSLTLTAFERYMLADDRVDYPMTFAIALHLAGEIDRAAFERSLRESLRQHPLLHAVVRGGAGKRPYWISAGEMPVELNWDEAGVAPGCAGIASLDLGMRPGLRICASRGEGRTELGMLFHHACCDGLGALRFIDDVLAAYDRRAGNERSESRAVDASRLASRGNLGRGEETLPARAVALFSALPHILGFVVRHSVPLAKPGEVPTRTDAGREEAATSLPKIERYVFSREQTQRLRDAAARGGATLNDLLMRDAFLTIDDWNRRHGGRRRGWLKISMPTNLRGPGDELMPAANMVSYTFLTRRARCCDDPQSLLADIQRETASIKRIRRGLCFIRAIEAVQAFCGKMPRLLVGRRSLATVVLSNLGSIERGLGAGLTADSGRITAGNLTLESVTTAPPIRPNTSAAFMVYCYGGRLNIGLNCDRKVFSREQSREFLREYTDRLEKTAF